MWQRQTRPMALGILWAMSVLIAVACATQCGCYNPSTEYPQVRTVLDQYASAVEIESTCIDLASGQIMGWNGSGVIVNHDTVLTAGHVASPQPDTLCSWKGRTRVGLEFNLIPNAVLYPDLDLASMKADVELPGAQPVYGPIPELGSIVCDATAKPHHEHRCGEVLPSRDPPGDLDTTMLVEPGNSGSGVYDSYGRLIGITVHMTFFHNGQIAGSHVSTLVGHLDVLL